jgi:predicted secreted protein
MRRFDTLIAFARIGLMALALALSTPHFARADVPAQPQNVLAMSAQASVEVQLDWLTVTLSTARDGPDAASVQAPLRQALDSALTEARKAARPGQLELRTGQFSLYPRYGPKGGITGWQGSAELVIEGRDMGAIGALAGRLNTMSIASVGYALARETREKVEIDAAAQAIARFRARAADYARQFGFAGYTIREVNVGGGEQPIVRPQVMRARSMAATAVDESLPVEAGKTSVTITVSGSVQMVK